MSKDAGDHEEERTSSSSTQSKVPTEATSRQWLKLPAPVKRIFDEFPLRTYPANELPQSTSTSRDKHALYVFATEEGARSGMPSLNPGCLKWQTYLKFQNIDFQCTPSSNHASPTGALPFLLPATLAPDSPLPIPSGRMQRWIRDVKSAKGSESNAHAISGKAKASQKDDDGHNGRKKGLGENSSEIRYDAYMSLLDHRIRNAYLYSLYLSPLNFDSVAFPLYVEPRTTNYLVRLALSQQLRSAAEAELLKESNVIDLQSIHRESERAFSALATLLGGDEYFFGDKQPSLFDASVFSYTNILLNEDLQWQIRHLVEGLEKHENLIRHRERILERYYGANA